VSAPAASSVAPIVRTKRKTRDDTNAVHAALDAIALTIQLLAC
jgi:hypothetical protein